MRRLLAYLILLSIAICGAQAPSFADLVRDEVVVKFQPGVPTRTQLDVLRKVLKLTTRRTGFGQSFIVVQVPRGTTAASLIGKLSARPEVLYAEQNVTTQATAAAPAADDFYFASMQWSLRSDEVGGIGVDRAWSVSTGAGVPVAVLDTGCAYVTAKPYYAAPDLDLEKIVPLWDWVNGDTKPIDDNGHGTFLCSLIASKRNNKIAIAGIAPDAILMVSKILDGSGRGRADWLASGITEAAQRGATIILIGCGTREYSRIVQDAINGAASGATVVIGAGNEGADLDLNPGAHAIYANTIVVGALNRGAQLASYSNYGSAIDLVAPGGDVFEGIWAQTFVTSDPEAPRYGFRADGNTIAGMQGTSVAAAHVAGVLALAWAAGHDGDLRSSSRSLMLERGGQRRQYAMVDASLAVGFGTRSSDEGSSDDSVPAISDVAVTRFAVPDAGVTAGSSPSVQVEVTNLGTQRETVTVSVRDDTAGEGLGSRSVDLEVGATATLDFTWPAQAPLGSHNLVAEAQVEGDIDLTNNVKTATSIVLARPLAVTIGSYDPLPGDEAHGPSQTTFRGGSKIGLEFNVTDSGSPAAGATVNYTVTGGSGATVGTGSISTDSSGRATSALSFYYVAGGPGTYRVDVTVTKGAETAPGSYTFLVTSTRTGR